MIRNARLLLTLFVCLLSAGAYAQSVDEIVDKYFAQIGGKDKWKALKSMKSTGKIKTQGMELPVVVYASSPNKMKMVINFQGKEIVQQAFDGQTGWSTNFMTMKPEKMEGEDSENMKEEAQMEDPFLDYKAKGFKAELEGKETIEGTECHKIKLTRKPVKVDGKSEENVSYYFFSVADNVPIMRRSVGKKGQMKGVTTEEYMSDYQEMNGIFVPMTLTIKMNGQTAASLALEKVETNLTIDEKSFAFPQG